MKTTFLGLAITFSFLSGLHAQEAVERAPLPSGALYGEGPGHGSLADHVHQSSCACTQPGCSAFSREGRAAPGPGN